MRNKLIVIIILMALMLSLCACGSIFEKEYVYERDYVAPSANVLQTDEKVSVRDFVALTQALVRMVREGRNEGVIIFDQAYEGDIAVDMADACWQVRTKNALCAYCVENISYELSKILTYSEASVTINYSVNAESIKNLANLSYSVGIEELIEEAMLSGDSNLTVFVANNSYSEDKIKQIVESIYLENPLCSPREPNAIVNMYSGTGLQRLFDIHLNYGVTDAEWRQFEREIRLFNPWDDAAIFHADDSAKALQACRYIVENCLYAESAQKKSAYSALIEGEANSEGLALAYVELCKYLGLDCRIVYGQKDWQSRCWNIVSIDGEFYHIDPTVCLKDGIEFGFLLSDEMMWGPYRWNTAQYPACTGTMGYADIAP